MRRERHFLATALLMIGAIVLIGCPPPEEGEQQAAVDTEEWNWLQTTHEDLQSRRAALKQVRRLASGQEPAEGEEIPAELAELGAEELAQRASDLEQEIYAALGLKEETLDAMRTAIIDRQNYSGTWMYAFPQFDFLRDEPEFQELVGIMHANLGRQFERIREMERNGEMPPAPGVDLERQ